MKNLSEKFWSIWNRKHLIPIKTSICTVQLKSWQSKTKHRGRVSVFLMWACPVSFMLLSDVDEEKSSGSRGGSSLFIILYHSKWCLDRVYYKWMRPVRQSHSKSMLWCFTRWMWAHGFKQPAHTDALWLHFTVLAPPELSATAWCFVSWVQN